MSWLFLALGAAFFWSGGSILVKKGFSNIPPLWNNLVNNFLTLFVWVPAVLLLSGFRIVVPPWPIPLVILGACLLYQFFYYSISRGQITLTGTIVAAYPAFTIALSHLFLGERLQPAQYLGVSLILAGSVVVALPRGAAVGLVAGAVPGPAAAGPSSYPASPRRLWAHSWVLWGLLGAFTLGTGDFLTKLSVNRIGSYSAIFFEALVLNLVSGLNFLIDRPHRRMPPLLSRRFLPTLFGILAHLVGALLFLVAFGYGPASLVGPVSSIYPAFVVLLAVRFLGETIRPKEGAGVGLTVAGLLLVGLGG